jgi:hypothetical protein
MSKCCRLPGQAIDVEFLAVHRADHDSTFTTYYCSN